MRVKTVKLTDETRDILLRSEINGNRLTLPEQLERASYQLVAKAIEAAGGKWNRKEKCHLFPSSARECMGITEDTVEIVNHKQTFQQFYTPEPWANEVARLAYLKSEHTVLEPSIGTGRIATAANRWGVPWKNITGIDADPKLLEGLQGMGFKQLVCADFLTCKPGPNKFDRVIMNPPFSMGDDIKHVRHALTFVKEGGILVSIVGAGPKQRAAFRGEWFNIPAGTFSESGTNVATAIVIIDC